jgi:acyl carrier protein
MSTTEIAERVRAFLAPHFAGHEVGDNKDIFALGYVNSLFAMQLVLFVEKEFGLSLEPEDLDLERFRSIATITELVAAKSAVLS